MPSIFCLLILLQDTVYMPGLKSAVINRQNCIFVKFD